MSSSIRNGNAVDITCQVLENVICSLDAGFAGHDPSDMPRGLGKAEMGQGLPRHGHELRPEDQ